MINQERLVNTFLTYVQIDSESLEEKDFALKVAEDFKALGACVSFDNAGEVIGGNVGNLYCKLAGDSSLEPILMSAHMDTVKPGKGIKPIIEGNIIKTDGTTVLGSDDKSGIVCILEALRYAKENGINHPPIEAVFTIAEEIGLKGSQNLDYSRITAKKGVVLDSGGDAGKIIAAAPGQLKLTGTFIGKGAHAGVAPEKGISAIQIAAHAISNMKLLRIDEETTANIGTITANYATNIVPEKVTIFGEARSRDNAKLKAQGEHMMKCIQDACEKFGGKFEGELTHSYSGYKYTEDDAFIKDLKAACVAAGLTPELAVSGGGSDVNNMVEKGVLAVNLGCGMDKVHTVNEQITIDNLVNTTKLLIELIRK